MVLTANRNVLDVELAWSGNNASYNVYRSTACASVFASIFATTSMNAYSDGSPPASELTCYNVLAYAPGPAPPEAHNPAP